MGTGRGRSVVATVFVLLFVIVVILLLFVVVVVAAFIGIISFSLLRLANRVLEMSRNKARRCRCPRKPMYI